MARRGFGGMNALRAALGAVTGVAEGLQQRDILAAQRKKEEEANSLARFNALQAAGFGFVPIRQAPGATAPSLMETPAGQPPAITPTAVGTALEKAAQGEVVPTPRPAGLPETPVASALDTVQAKQPGQRISVAGMEFGLLSPQEVAADREARQLSLYEKQRGIDVQTDKQKKDVDREFEKQQASEMATLIQATFVDSKGKPLSRQAAEYAARQGKTPIELGLIEKPMTEAERKSLAVQWARLSLDRQRFEQDKKDKAAGEGGRGGDAQATNTQGTITQDEINRLRGMMPIPEIQNGKIVGFKAPATNLGTTDVRLAQSDWTNWMASDEAQFYFSMAGAIADAKARRSEKGTLSNQDIERYRNQVKIRMGDSDQTKYDKFQRLLRWAQEGGAPTGAAKPSTGEY